ncbi:DUF3883 domain-containing protein [Bathymodiolus thermophilus thioautotrophic gill symbiont]|nr:DUF3883 domain-containing protein [Bathymodiolus thermophilus thioautotrophic gill symbiont]
MIKNKHKNYEILNLIGYGISKFNDDFIKQFKLTTKNSFYQFCVDNGVAETISTVKNRVDLFDPFFPNNGRKGWWQKGDAYIHRKELIDHLFGNENVEGYANIVKIHLKDNFNMKNIAHQEKPIIISRFKKLQETGLEAELFFMNNYNSINIFKGGSLEDARLYGDGYDFQISTNKHSYLAEVKGIRESKGKFRLTEKEYKKAQEYEEDYIMNIVTNLDQIPKICTIKNPIKNLSFNEKIAQSQSVKEYHLIDDIEC